MGRPGVEYFRRLTLRSRLWQAEPSPVAARLVPCVRSVRRRSIKLYTFLRDTASWEVQGAPPRNQAAEEIVQHIRQCGAGGSNIIEGHTGDVFVRQVSQNGKALCWCLHRRTRAMDRPRRSCRNRPRHEPLKLKALLACSRILNSKRDQSVEPYWLGWSSYSFERPRLFGFALISSNIQLFRTFLVTTRGQGKTIRRTALSFDAVTLARGHLRSGSGGR